MHGGNGLLKNLEGLENYLYLEPIITYNLN